MLKLLPIEFLLRTIPESFILILAGYAFSSKKPKKKVFCISAILLAISTYLIRILPIHFGVHTIILIVIYVLISVNINKINIIKAISAGLTSSIILFLCEWINVFVLTKVLKLNIDFILKPPVNKIVYSLPSLALFSMIVMLVFYINVLHRKGCKNVFYRETVK
jgi:hypothetical protein